MSKLVKTKTVVVATVMGVAGLVLLLGAVTRSVAEDKLKATVFIGPSPLYDSIQMADSQGFLKDEGLDINFRLFPSGTTALQTFQSGIGDMVTSGELPGVNYWVRVKKDLRIISVIERDSAGYLVTASKDIKKPQDLIGKTVATRVGSTGSWFISEYLKGNGIKPSDVKVINLDTQVLPTALCKGDISAFFIWEPFGTRAREICPDKAHTLSTAEGYIHGYAVISARPEWLKTKEGSEIATRFIRAMLKGAKFAANNFDAVAKYNADKFGLSKKAAHYQWSINGRHIGFDKVFFQDYFKLASWTRGQDLLKGKLDFNELIWTKGIKAVDPKLLAKIPGPC